MNQKERFIIIGVLAIIAVMVGADIITDSLEGVNFWHLLSEGFIGGAALFGIFYILRGSVELKHKLEKEISNFSEFKKESEAWKSDAKKYLDGLSGAIDLQLQKWNLSASEKEVAFLLLKGLSLKEIATSRNTSEKTARAQSSAIYLKAGIAGRSELSAFFLEDLLVPSEVYISNPK